jgi:hypothetical protein
MNLSDDFELIVSEDIKNKASQQDKDLLRLPDNHEAWKECLLNIIKTVSDKIDVLQSEINQLRSMYSGFDIDPAASLEEQKEKATRFRFYAEKRLAEVDRLITLGEPSDPSLSLATFLREAIVAHRDWHTRRGLVNSEGDDYLYAALDGEWRF